MHGVRLFATLATAGAEASYVLAFHHEGDNAATTVACKPAAEQLAKVLATAAPVFKATTTKVARAIAAVKTNGYFITDEEGRRLGSGYYAVAALINHSCEPNAIVGFNRGVMSVRAIRPIAAGEEVTVSYTELYRPVAIRSASLKDRKGFQCTCSRCLRDTGASAIALVGAYACCSGAVCPGWAVANDSRIVCTLCGTVRPESPEEIRTVQHNVALAREASAQDLAAGRLAQCVKKLEAALSTSFGYLHPAHFERFECHVLITDALSLMRPLPREKLLTHAQLALWCAEATRAYGGNGMSPRLAKLHRLIGTVYVTEGRLGRANAPRQPEIAIRQFTKAYKIVRCIWGNDHPASRAVDQQRAAIEAEVHLKV